MKVGFDSPDLDELSDTYSKVARYLPDKEKKMLKEEGRKLRKKTKDGIKKAMLGRKTGKYRKSIKLGKVYKYHGVHAVRVYSTAPHAHMIEKGHRMVTHDGHEVGYVTGYFIFQAAAKEFTPELVEDLNQWLDQEVVNPLED